MPLLFLWTLWLACSGPSATPTDAPEAAICADGPRCVEEAAAFLDGDDRPEALRRLEHACEALEHGPACAELAEVLLSGKGIVAGEPAVGAAAPFGRAVAALKRACALGEGPACHRAAMFHAKGKGIPKDDKEARRLLGLGCASGDGASCVDHGILLERGDGGPADRGAALAAYARSCDLEEARGCAKLGVARLQGIGGDPDPDGALEAYDRACRLGSYPGCGLAAQAHEGGIVPADPAKRAFYLGAGARLGDGYALGALVTLAAEAPAAATILEELAAGTATACAARDATACFAHVGASRALGAPADASGLRVACDGGHGLACGWLALAHDAGEVVPRDPGQTMVLHEQGCAAGELASCLVLIEAYTTGERVQRPDPGAADRTRRRACTLGHEPSCIEARRP